MATWSVEKIRENLVRKRSAWLVKDPYIHIDIAMLATVVGEVGNDYVRHQILQVLESASGETGHGQGAEGPNRWLAQHSVLQVHVDGGGRQRCFRGQHTACLRR